MYVCMKCIRIYVCVCVYGKSYSTYKLISIDYELDSENKTSAFNYKDSVKYPQLQLLQGKKKKENLPFVQSLWWAERNISY